MKTNISVIHENVYRLIQDDVYNDNIYLLLYKKIYNDNKHFNYTSSRIRRYTFSYIKKCLLSL